MLRPRKELEGECWGGVSPVGGTRARLCCFRLMPPPYLGKMPEWGLATPGSLSAPPPRDAPTPQRAVLWLDSPPVWTILPLAAGTDLVLS